MQGSDNQQREVAMKIDFSNINLQYLIQFRDVAREDPDLAASLMGMSPELAQLLAQVPGDYLAKISNVKIPLLTVRGDVIWWYRLFMALSDENSDEVEAVLRSANLAVLA
jgi:hypothetical protein